MHRTDRCRPGDLRSRAGLPAADGIGQPRFSADPSMCRLAYWGRGLGSCLPARSGRLTRPPRKDSLTFKNRSQARRVGLGQKSSWREDVPVGGLDQLREPEVQTLLQQRPLRCVAECEDTGPIGLEKLAATFISLWLKDPRPSFPCNLLKDCSEVPPWVSSGAEPVVE